MDAGDTRFLCSFLPEVGLTNVLPQQGVTNWALLDNDEMHLFNTYL